MNRKLNLKTDKLKNFIYDDNKKISSLEDAMLNIICSYNISLKCYKLQIHKYIPGKPSHEYVYQEESDYRPEELNLKTNYHFYYNEYYTESCRTYYEYRYPAFSIYEFVYLFIKDYLNIGKYDLINIFDSPIDKGKFLIKVNNDKYLRNSEQNNEFPKNKEGYIEGAISILNYYIQLI